MNCHRNGWSHKPLMVIIRFLKLLTTLNLINAFKLAILSRISTRTISLKLNACDRLFYIRGKTADDTVVEAIFADREYPILPHFSPKRIVDAGAHCGAASAFFAAHYPEAQIVAIEPDQSNFEMLD